MEGFQAFARALSSEVDDLRGCLIATRDGRVVGIHPSDSTNVDAAWRRIAPLRVCTSAIVRFDRETWCVAGHDSYVALAVVDPSTDAERVVSHMARLLAEADRAGTDVGPSTIVLPEPPGSGDRRTTDENGEVDRAALVQEFSLLQENQTAADG